MWLSGSIMQPSYSLSHLSEMDVSELTYAVWKQSNTLWFDSLFLQTWLNWIWQMEQTSHSCWHFLLSFSLDAVYKETFEILLAMLLLLKELLQKKRVSCSCLKYTEILSRHFFNLFPCVQIVYAWEDLTRSSPWCHGEHSQDKSTDLKLILVHYTLLKKA